jgi:hypothetical protein
MESNSAANSIQSTMGHILDRCLSPPLDNEIRLCLNDLCQRVVFIVDQSSTEIYNQLPSPVFKRKMEKQTDEQSLKKKPNRLSRKKSLTDNISNPIVVTEKKEELIEQELPDVKTMISTSVSTNTSDYICEWDNCRL